ncbi:hypothetical protein OG819_00300 [Streptomyces sp. NBC_01549]|uniref:hypothetical protein n=1 Tax=Streptomyces sp. NBC_01549 TaxID=2975874 RepID=UPI002250848D|nr:hypothetical protein [Streptomyces sp. NBC_01549]MCX4588244.1 hypothetical protein [Streptomyces sp. NBC_01549]
MTAGRTAFRAALRAQAAEPPHLVTVTGASLPAWAWHLAAALHDLLPADVADDWAARLHTLLTGQSPTRGLYAVHRWQAGTVLPLPARTSHARDTAAVTALADLHTSAARGTPTGQDAWLTALTPVLLRLHDAAYDRASAYAQSHTAARDFALANGFSATEADAYAHEYARLSSGANARAFAESHAQALGEALALAHAYAYATDSCEAYTETFPSAQVRAVVRAVAGTAATGTTSPSTVRLADGLLTALRPVGRRDRGSTADHGC